jgi:flagellar protein FliO/FliZ
MLKVVCAVVLLASFHAMGADTSPEVLEAEKLIASTVAPAENAANAGELKTPEVPKANESVSEQTTEVVSALTAPTAVTKESDIPVQLEPAKKSSSDHSLYFKAVLSLIVIGGMGVAGYVLIGRYRRANLGKNPATQIKVLTQHYLGPKKSLAIVRVAGESVLIGITDHNISMLKSLSLLDEDIPEEIPQQFSSLFSSKSEDLIEEPQLAKPMTMALSKVEEEEFSISGIKDFVSTRLKNMRTLE